MQELLFVNPSSLDDDRLENPRGKKRRKGGKRFSAKQRAWQKTFAQRYGGGKKKRKKGKRRSNPQSIVYKGTKKRVSNAAWRKSPYRRNPHRRRNPANFARAFSVKGVTNTVMEAAQGAVGATVVDIVMGQVVRSGVLPAVLLSQPAYSLVKAAGAIGLGVVVTQFAPRGILRNIGAEMAKGSLTVTLAGLIRSYLPVDMTMGRYMRGMGYSVPGTVLRSYLPNRSGVGAYMQGAELSDAMESSGYAGATYTGV